MLSGRKKTACSPSKLFADGVGWTALLVDCMDWRGWTVVVAVSHCEKKTLDGLGPD